MGTFNFDVVAFAISSKKQHINVISMVKYRKDVTPLLKHWSYVFLVLTHRFWH